MEYWKPARRGLKVEERIHPILSASGTDVVETSTAALRYIVSRPAVSPLTPGETRSDCNAGRNSTAGDGKGLLDAHLLLLKSHHRVRTVTLAP